MRSQVVPADKEACMSAKNSASVFLTKKKIQGQKKNNTFIMDTNSLVFSNAPFLLLRIVFVEFFNVTLCTGDGILPTSLGSRVTTFHFLSLLFTPLSCNRMKTKERTLRTGDIPNNLWFVLWSCLCQNWSRRQSRWLRLWCKRCSSITLLHRRLQSLSATLSRNEEENQTHLLRGLNLWKHAFKFLNLIISSDFHS